MPSGSYPLPFNLILKSTPRVTEQEGLAMNLARAMCVSAPRFISFVEPPPGDVFGEGPSLLMTKVPEVELDEREDDKANFDIIKDDLVRILILMRSFSSPWGTAICGVDGGSVAGPLVPASSLPASPDKAAFYDLIRYIGYFEGKDNQTLAGAEKSFALAPHAVVFTHGDVNRHNIMVGPDGHISGIIDWEVLITAILPERSCCQWGRFMDEVVTSGVYAEEVVGHRHMTCFIADSLSFRWVGSVFVIPETIPLLIT